MNNVPTIITLGEITYHFTEWVPVPSDDDEENPAMYCVAYATINGEKVGHDVPCVMSLKEWETNNDSLLGQIIRNAIDAINFALGHVIEYRMNATPQETK